MHAYINKVPRHQSFTCTYVSILTLGWVCRDVTTLLDADMDVLLLCTSISSLSEVVGSMPLTRLKRPTLFVDVLSVKEHPRNLLLQVRCYIHPSIHHSNICFLFSTTCFIRMINLVLYFCFVCVFWSLIRFCQRNQTYSAHTQCLDQ